MVVLINISGQKYYGKRSMGQKKKIGRKCATKCTDIDRLAVTLGSTLHKCSGPVYPKVVLAGQTSRGCCLYVCKRRRRRISLSLCASSESERREFLLLGEYEKAKQTTNNNNNRLSE